MGNGVKRVAFIDLEDTVIEPVLQGWIAAEPIGLARNVGKLLREWKPDEVRVFSFSVRNESDAQGFRVHVQPWLERLLGFTISDVPTTDGVIFPAVARLAKLHPSRLDFSDVVDFWGKGGAFRLFAKTCAINAAEPLDVLLVDDAVDDEEFAFPRLRLSGRLVNAEQL